VLVIHPVSNWQAGELFSACLLEPQEKQ